MDLRNSTVILPLVINQYKYLGTVIDDKLTIEAHVNSLCNKAHQRI